MSEHFHRDRLNSPTADGEGVSLMLAAVDDLASALVGLADLGQQAPKVERSTRRHMQRLQRRGQRVGAMEHGARQTLALAAALVEAQGRVDAAAMRALGERRRDGESHDDFTRRICAVLASPSRMLETMCINRVRFIADSPGALFEQEKSR